MNFLLVTIGSHGDVHPFIGLGAALRRRGHDVTLMTNGYFEPLAQKESIPFVAFGSSEEYLEMTKNPELWSRRNGFKTVFSSVLDILPRVYVPIVKHLRAHPDAVVIGSSLAIAARIAQDKLGFAMMTVHLAPGIFRSSLAPPRLPGLFMPSWFPMWFKKKLWAFGDRRVIDPFVAPRLNEFRAAFGLPPVFHVLRDWWLSPDMVVGMFPEWFAKPQADWPAQSRLTGFPLFDERGHDPIPPEVEKFLADGDRPIAFTPGSAMFFGERFFQAAADACTRLGRRGILLSRHREHIPASLPPGVIHADYAPFSELLPRCAALVHHGGIGTSSQALQAGVPQLIMAMTHDQPDNAARIEALGVGEEISPRRFTAKNVAKKLHRLIDDPAVVARCRQIKARFAGVNGIEMTCDLAESLYRRSPHPAALTNAAAK